MKRALEINAENMQQSLQDPIVWEMEAVHLALEILKNWKKPPPGFHIRGNIKQVYLRKTIGCETQGQGLSYEPFMSGCERSPGFLLERPNGDYVRGPDIVIWAWRRQYWHNNGHLVLTEISQSFCLEAPGRFYENSGVKILDGRCRIFDAGL